MIELNDGDGGSIQIEEMDGSPAIVFPKGQNYFCFHKPDHMDCGTKPLTRQKNKSNQFRVARLMHDMDLKVSDV